MRVARAGGSGTGTGSLKKTIIPSPVKRSSVPSWARISRPISAWYSPQDPHDVLGLGGLGERGEAAEIQEHDGDLAPVAAQRILGAARNDQLRELRREEALEPADALSSST